MPDSQNSLYEKKRDYRKKRRHIAPEYSPEQIKRLREKLGLSVIDFVFILGIDAPAYRHWLTGKRHPTKTGHRLLSILNTYPELAGKILKDGLK